MRDWGLDWPAPMFLNRDEQMFIQYIGHREEYKDALYGSGFWLKGQAKEIPDVVAVRMLKHPDTYDVALPDPGLSQQDGRQLFSMAAWPSVTAKPKGTELDGCSGDEDHDQTARDAINAMSSKEAIADYAKINFGQVIPRTLSVENMRQRAIMMIDQYGSM